MGIDNLENYEVMSTKKGYNVVMGNKLIEAKNTLNLNSAKLIRAVIMQIKPDDTIIKPYKVTIQEFNNLLGENRNKKSIYREVNKICDDLTGSILTIYDKENPKNKWLKMPWVAYCKREGKYITIKLNDELTPYVMGLVKTGNYTQYELGYILTLKSVYAIRLFELIKMGLSDKDLYKYKECQVEVMLDVLRRATNTEDKFERISNLKEKVIDIAIKDINGVPFGYRINPNYKPIKYGKKIIGFEFTVTNWTSELPPPDEKTKRKIAEIKRKQAERKEQEQLQMNLNDYI